MFLNAFSSPHLRAAPSCFSTATLAARISGGGAVWEAAAIFLRSRCGELRLCYASRTDERGRDGRGSPASQRVATHRARVYLRACTCARASRRVTQDTLRR